MSQTQTTRRRNARHRSIIAALAIMFVVAAAVFWPRKPSPVVGTPLSVRSDQRVIALLQDKLPEVRFDNLPFTDVLRFLSERSGARFVVNREALVAAGIDDRAPVTARLRNVTVSKALETVLRDVGGGTVRLGYTVADGVVTVSTAQDLSRDVRTETFDIRDLIGPTAENGVSNGIVDQVIQLIADTVATDTWQVNGGKSGLIREQSGQLIITQTPENLRQVGRLMEQLRRARRSPIKIHDDRVAGDAAK